MADISALSALSVDVLYNNRLGSDKTYVIVWAPKGALIAYGRRLHLGTPTPYSRPYVSDKYQEKRRKGYTHAESNDAMEYLSKSDRAKLIQAVRDNAEVLGLPIDWMVGEVVENGISGGWAITSLGVSASAPTSPIDEPIESEGW